VVEDHEPTPANGTSDERVTTVPVTLCESPTVCFQKKEAVPGSLGATDAGTAFMELVLQTTCAKRQRCLQVVPQSKTDGHRAGI